MNYRFSKITFYLSYYRKTDQNDQSEDVPEEFRFRYTSHNSHSLNECTKEAESTPTLTRRRECSVAKNEQKRIEMNIQQEFESFLT